MNYIYGVLLLHSAGKELSEASVAKVVEATGEKAEPAQVKALVASLQGVNIDEAIKQAVVSAAPSGGGSGSAHAAEKKEEKKEDEGKKAEEAAAGLSGLFG